MSNFFVSELASMASELGQSTLINGTTLKVYWTRASQGSVERYIDPASWHRNVYKLILPTSVVSSPYNLKTGDEITDALSRKFIVRTLNPITLDSAVCYEAIVESIEGE